ncbi:peptidylprolyl isomerase [Haliovirga abyssi]|uniref:PpiC domain-containing protein n=1 Tax=Haliovirga abyssi TaxID=2996794 RepID=A0AAU9E450_9FUSO|nr:peptidylprolyl isomerase [Haliovirga abyssi]BDU51270.1 hypothetical protein HLVA_18390 [Haliovirga abyssi]
MIRKLRKTLKPVIWVLTIAFVISVFFIGAAGTIGSVNKRFAVKVGKKKIEVTKVERLFENSINSYRQYYKDKVDPEIVKVMTFNGIIEQEILIESAKKLKVKLSGKEFRAAYNKATSGITSQKQLRTILKYQGLTIADLKKDIKDETLANKVKKAVKAEYKLPETKVKEYYENNKFGRYKGKKYADEKKGIEKELKDTLSQKYYSKWLADKLEATNIEIMEAYYNKYLNKDVIKAGNYTIDNMYFLTTVFSKRLFGAKDEADAYKKALEALKENVALAQEAIKSGEETNENYVVSDQIADLGEKLKKSIRKNYKYSDKDLKEYFNKNHSKYDQKETAKANIILLKLKPSDADKAAAKAKAEKILKEALAGKTKFSELAKKYSEGPSGPNGGELGWFTQKQMVKEFADAAFKGEKGKVYPEVVKTQFGYHIIKVEDINTKDKKVKASHILIKEDVGAKTKEELTKKANGILKDIQSGKIKIDEAMKKYSEASTKKEIDSIEKGGYIAGVGYDKKLTEELFKMKKGDFKVISTDKGDYILNLTGYTPFKAATLEEKKDEVIYNFLNEKVADKISKLKKELGPKVKVEILDEDLKSKLK